MICSQLLPAVFVAGFALCFAFPEAFFSLEIHGGQIGRHKPEVLPQNLCFFLPENFATLNVHSSAKKAFGKRK
jgi:hypothetical protein